MASEDAFEQVSIWKRRYARREMTGSRRALWAIADQAASSLSNFAVALLVARSVSAEEFGAFTLAYAVYLFVLEFARPLVCEPLLIRFSGAAGDVLRPAGRETVGLSAIVGLVLAAMVLIAGLVMTGTARGPMIALAVVLAGLLVQDATRYVMFAAGRMRAAAINDALWAVLQIVAMLGLAHADQATATKCLLAWGVTGALCGVFGLLQTKSIPSFAGGIRWLKGNRHLTPGFMGEFIVESGVFQLTLLAIGAVAGLVGLGSFNAARVLLGPIGIVYLVAMSFGVSECSRLRERGDHRLLMVIRGFGVLLPLVAIVWTVVLLVLPHNVGRALLGDSWDTGRKVVLPLAIYWIARGANNGARIGLRVFSAPKVGLGVQLILAPLTLVAGTVGAFLDGARGSASGLAIVTTAGIILWWQRLEKTARVSPERSDAEAAS